MVGVQLLDDPLVGIQTLQVKPWTLALDWATAYPVGQDELVATYFPPFVPGI